MPLPPAIPGTRPVAPSERIASLDILRGLALCGVILMNIQSFGLVMTAYENPFHLRDLGALDRLVWGFQHHLVEGRAVSVFSMLFGAGVVISTQGQDRLGLPSAGYFYRRYGILAGVGLLHANLIWFGDILLPYALCAFVIFLLRKRSARVLAVLGLGSLLLSSLLAGGLTQLLHWIPEIGGEVSSYWWPSAATIQEEIDRARGSWSDWWLQNAQNALWMHLAMPFGLIQFTGGLMLLGMSLQKSGFFAAKWSRHRYLAASGATLLLGALCTIPTGSVEALVDGHIIPPWRYALAEWGGPLMGFGYMSGLMAYLSLRAPGPVLGAFAAAGRMALTLYLTQSIIAGFIFNGYGLGNFERLGHASLALIALAIFTLQLTFASMWFRRFQQGPLEALWRRASYRTRRQ